MLVGFNVLGVQNLISRISNVRNSFVMRCLIWGWSYLCNLNGVCGRFGNHSCWRCGSRTLVDAGGTGSLRFRAQPTGSAASAAQPSLRSTAECVQLFLPWEGTATAASLKGSVDVPFGCQGEYCAGIELKVPSPT